jgi:hypothetical protein
MLSSNLSYPITYFIIAIVAFIIFEYLYQEYTVEAFSSFSGLEGILRLSSSKFVEDIRGGKINNKERLHEEQIEQLNKDYIELTKKLQTN